KAMKDDIKEYTDALKKNNEDYERELIKLNLTNATAIERNNALIDKLTADLEVRINYLAYIQKKFADENGKIVNGIMQWQYNMAYATAKQVQQQIDETKANNEKLQKEQEKQKAAEQAAEERARQRAEAEKERLKKLAEDYENYNKQINEILQQSADYNKSLEEEKLMSNLDTFGKIEHLRNKDLEGVETWYLEQLNFLEQYKNDKAKYDKALEQLEQARLVKRADINTKYDIELAVERQKFEENYTKFLEKEEQKRLQQTLDALKENDDKEEYLIKTYNLKKQEIEDKYQQLIDEARMVGNEKALEELQAMKDAELEIIKNTHEAEIKMNEEALEQMRKDRNRAAIQMNLEYSEKILGGLSQIFASMSQMSEENSKQQKTLAMVSLALNQAAAMGAAVRAAIDGAKDMPDPISKIAYFVTTLATFMGIITSTIMQARQIANSGNMSGGGISSGVANNISSNYSAVQENKSTEQQSQRVYVVESDITSTQNRIRRISVNQVL
ncbi:MAG TPA: hypothetical protein PKN54_09965, partial [Candidatus Cloacimonas acidaminovorans]|nr:hypothetical protein [Candidatus Cloacimonas acidaminovorans]